jgi:hypothetical protein
MKSNQYDNESAAGATISLVAVFLLSCILFILIGYGIDRIILTSINIAASMPATQMRYDTIMNMIMVFRFEPFIIIIGAGINTWVVSTRSQSGDVDLGGLLGGAAEMLLLTVGMIALVMFGGAALESVVSVINNVPFVVTEQIGLYSMIMYIGPIFYGLCFLGLVGAVIQFVMLCVQTVDY